MAKWKKGAQAKKRNKFLTKDNYWDGIELMTSHHYARSLLENNNEIFHPNNDSVLLNYNAYCKKKEETREEKRKRYLLRHQPTFSFTNYCASRYIDCSIHTQTVSLLAFDNHLAFSDSTWGFASSVVIIIIYLYCMSHNRQERERERRKETRSIGGDDCGGRFIIFASSVIIIKVL